MAIILTEIEAGSARDAELLALRTRVLRAPLGLHYTQEQLAAETGQARFAAVVDGTIAACLLFARLDDTTVKIRQMAVDVHHQGTGLGITLLHYAEAIARNQFYKTVELHARETAIGFYERAGYRTIGESFTEVTIPHQKMAKDL
jgi:predicted GNAT family N-acyltransferase